MNGILTPGEILGWPLWMLVVKFFGVGISGILKVLSRMKNITNASGEKFQIMHCNLGARSDNAASVGYGGAIYQWGRKDPLWPNNDYRYGDGKTGLFFSTFRGMQKDAVTFEDAIKNPTQFIEADDWFGNDECSMGRSQRLES